MFCRWAVLACFALYGAVFAQSHVNASANIKVKLINSMMFSIVKSNVVFNESSRSVKAQFSLKPPSAVSVRFNGSNNKNRFKTTASTEIQFQFPEQKLGYSPAIQTHVQNFLTSLSHNAKDYGLTSAIEISKDGSGTINSLLLDGILHLRNSSEDDSYQGLLIVSLTY